MSDEYTGSPSEIVSCNLAKTLCRGCGQYRLYVSSGLCADCSREPEPKAVWSPAAWNRPWTAEERAEWDAMMREGDNRP